MSDQSTADARATIARLTDEVLPMLIKRLRSSQLGELEVREDGWRVRLRRPVAGDTNADARQSATPGSTARRSDAQPAHVDRPARPEPPKGVISSPGVGYFTPRDGVAVGARLRRGDAVGHVDVLGVRQEVVSPIDGTLRALEAETGQAVEYGQSIGRIEPDA